MSNKKVKVFRLNDYEWFAGYDMESVKKEYLAMTGFNEGDTSVFDEPCELSDNEMRLLKHAGDCDKPHRRPVQFKTELSRMIKAGEKFPCCFATTEQ